MTKALTVETKEEEAERLSLPDFTLPEAPDGGFGLVVVAASFTMGLIVDGCLFTFGIMTMEFVDHFKTNKMTIALAGSVMNGVYLSVGPLVSGLVNKFGCRAVAVAGSLVAASGFVVCIFSSNVAVLIVTYGALSGVGFGMMHLPSIVMVGFYFTKKRAFATGIAMCGSGIGAFIFAPFIQQLLYVYDWRGAQMILAGVVLQGCIMGLLFRPLNMNDLKPKSVKTDAEKQEFEPLNHNRYELTSLGSDLQIQESNTSLHLSQYGSRSLSPRALRKDLLYTGSLVSLHRSVSRDMMNRTSSRDKVYKVASHESMEKTKKECCQSVLEFMDFSLLKSATFDLYGLSCFLMMAGFFIPFMFLPELAVSQGISRDGAAILLSIIGIANTVGRVICGWVSDQPWADCLVVNIFALIMGGVALVLVPAFRSTYALLGVSSALFGLSIAVFASLRSIIMVELMGLDRLTNAFGLVTMFQGMSTFIGNPLAGALYDLTHDYNTLFYVAGALLVLAGVVCVPCRKLAIREARTLKI